MEKAMYLDGDLSIRYDPEVMPLECRADVPGNGRGAKPGVRVLRLVTTIAEGGELLRRLADDPLTSGIPIVILAR